MLCWLSFEDTEDGGFQIRPGLPEGAAWSQDSQAHAACLRLLKIADSIGERVPSEDEIAEVKKAQADAAFQANQNEEDEHPV